MFNTQFNWRLCLLLLLIGVQSVPAAEVVYGTARHTTRAQVWTSFTSAGTQGMHYDVSATRIMMRMNLPGWRQCHADWNDSAGIYRLLGREVVARVCTENRIPLKFRG